MTNPVAPVKGHYALLRNNEVTRPRPDQWANKAAFFDGLHHWWQDGTSVENCDAFDIIATISPADMQAAASGELARLRAALQKLHDGLAWDWRGHPVDDLPTLREIAREALEGGAG